VKLLPAIVLGAGLGCRALIAGDAVTLDPAHPLVGTLESDPARDAATSQAGSPAVVIGVSWDRCEPGEGKFDDAYLQSIATRIAAFRADGKSLVLDLGVQYPPQWIFALPSSHFVNQYGDAFAPAPGAGECGVNLVFSQAMRERYAAYLDHLFGALGNGFAAVRLGGGRYGELGYPSARSGGRMNCYWAFDPIAQGQLAGLPPGEEVCPIPGWTPGTPTPGHDSARRFLDWYLRSLENYHDWQIADARRHFGGPLFMLYPSTGGLRPGQLEAAIGDDCNGATGPEQTGEVGRGYDTARFVAGIGDSGVVVYTTWVDGFEGSDDTSSDPRRWSPGHYLASLAAAHQPPLLVGGENTGHPDDLANLELTFQRMRENHLCALFWAFEPTLFDGKSAHATLADFKQACLRTGPP